MKTQNLRKDRTRKMSSSQDARNLRRLLVEAMALEPQEIGARIRHARELAGLRQEDLADLISVSTRTVQNLEAGDVKPYNHIGRVAQALAVTQDWLLHGDPAEQLADADRLADLEARLVRHIVRVEQEQGEQAKLLAELLRIARGDPSEPRSDQG